MRYNGDFNPVDDLFDKQNSNQNNSLNTSVPNTQNMDSVIQENNESWQNNNVTNTNYNQSIIEDNMINNENINNDINDIQYNQNNNKRGFNKSIIYAIVGFILFIAVGIVITNLVIEIIKQKKSNEEEISVLMDSLSVKAVGFEFDQPFDKNKFEYNLEIDTQKVQFKCNKIDSVTGCNETVNLVNKTNLDHIIEYTSQKGKKYSYTFHIIKKDTNGPIKIDSIEFEKTDYSNKSTTIVVKANSDKNKKLKYSFDGGNTWQDDNKYTTDENEDVNVVIKDDAGNTTDPKEIEIDNIDTVAPTVNIEEKEKSSNKVVLFANAKDDSSGIDKYNWNESGYTNNSTYEATKAGTYTVKVKDKAGNESVKASITIPESYFKKNVKKETHTYKVTFNGNGASVTKSELSCSTTGLSCKIKLPQIKRDNGIIIGYSENANATTPQYKVGQEISVTENKTLYAITAKKITLTINGNGATVKDTEKKCYIYNKKTSCKITTPIITRSGYSIIGFNSNANAKTAGYKTNASITLDKDKTIYAITSKKLKLTVNGNGAKVTKSSVTCNVYNNDKTCKVTTPTITRSGYSVIGFNSNSNATSPEYKTNTSVTLDKNKTMYAITSKKLTATFKGNGASVSSSSSSCNIYNTAKTCNVTAPTITRSGWTILGFSTNKNATTGSTAKTLSAGKTYYAITKKNIKVTFTENNNKNTYPKAIKNKKAMQVKFDYIEYREAFCSIYNTQTSCKIKIPFVDVKGLASSGFSPGIDEKTGPGSPKTIPNTLDYELAPHYITGNTYSFSKSTTLYAVFETLDYYRDFRSTIEHTLTYTSSTGRIIIDIEKGCSRDHYKKYFDEIKNSKFKFLLDGNAKIMVLTNDSMKKVHSGQDVAGVSFSLTGAGYYHYNISLNCKYDSDKYDYLTFYTIIHELSHRWDARYYLATGTTLNSKFTSFYNKYKSNNSWPIRDYGKGSLGEFFGVIVDEYYMNYIANTNLHPIPYDRKKGLYPSDLKKALETYINNPKNANF